MDLRQLRYFVAVAEEQHFGRAALRVHISQPPLSMQIRKLEDELGAQLLERHTRKVILTDAGHVLLERARRILADVEDARQATRHALTGLYGRIEVGFVSSATLTVLPPALRDFHAQYPAVELGLQEITTGQQLDALYHGTIRLGLVRMPVHASFLHIEPLLREPLTVALPTDHMLASFERLTTEMVAEHPLIFFSRQFIPGFHDHILRLFHAIGRTPKAVQYAIHLETITGLVASGLGIAILPGPSSRMQREGVVYRPLNAPDAESWLAVAHLESTHSLLVDNFKQALRTAAADFQAERAN